MTAQRQAAATDLDRPFVISRIFKGPRELVFAAWTEGRRMMEWWGAKGMTLTPDSRFDLRAGGMFHYGMKGPDGAVNWGRWAITEVVPGEKVGAILSFSDAQGGITHHPMAAVWPLETASVMRFEDAPGGETRVTIEWTPHKASEAERQAFAAAHEGMAQGWGGTFEQLDAYLAAGAK